MEVMKAMNSQPLSISNNHSSGTYHLFGLKGNVFCDFSLINGGQKVIVASGIAYLERKTIHIKPIPPHNVCVCIDDYGEGYGEFELPVPSNDIIFVRDAASSFVQWPRHLVIPKQDKNSGANDVASSHIPNNPNPINPNPSNPRVWQSMKSQFLDQLTKDRKGNEVIYVKDVNMDIVHPKYSINDVMISIQATKDLLSGNQLEASVIEVYMFGLKPKFGHFFKMIGYGNPSLILATIWDNKITCTTGKAYLEKNLEMNNKKRFVLLPYHQERHWVLYVVNMPNKQIYIFDPAPKLGKMRKMLINDHLHDVLHGDSKQPTSKRPKKNDKDKYIQASFARCARQPGGVECGYYVMRFMYDIVVHYHHCVDLIKGYGRYKAFAVEELQEVVDIFASHVIHYM